MKILAIDPGTTESAYLVYNSDTHEIEYTRFMQNEVLKDGLKLGKLWPFDVAVCEWVSSFGMPVGSEVFETCRWVGRFEEHVNSNSRMVRIKRSDIKLFLCGNARAKDANIRQALLDRFPATGGGSVPQVGTKSKPGPLYGIFTHLWAALAVAVTYTEADPKIQERFL
jgi:hypothetical protein